MVRLISWNIAGRITPWSALTDVDVALLQEATRPPDGVTRETIPGAASWAIAGQTTRTFCSAIARLSDRVKLAPIELARPGQREDHQAVVSRPGTLALARALLPDDEEIIVGSMYACWESAIGSNWIYADASVHRLISDLSVLVGSQRGHRILVAGDLNVLYGYGEDGSPYWAARYRTIFERMEAIGIPLVGPQFPNGRRADRWPAELPGESLNVPTFRTSSGAVCRQLDFVFASRELHDRLAVRALNAPDEWGPSDHCRIAIDLREDR